MSTDDRIDPLLGTEAVDMDEPVMRLNFDVRALWHTAVLRWAASAIGFAAIALWPSRAASALATVSGVALVAVGLVTALAAARSRDGRFSDLAFSSILLVTGGILLIADIDEDRNLGRVFAIVIVGFAVLALITRLQEPGRGPGFLAITLLVLASLLLVLFPRELFGFLTAALALFSATMAAITMGQLQRVAPADRPHISAASLIGDWFDSRPKSVEQRSELYDKVFYEGEAYSRRFARFLALMGFAAAIASLGVITDSTAVVIGAMLVAPLMIPLMGVAVALSMGWPRRLSRTVIVAIAGAGLAILIGFLLGMFLGGFVDVATNSQIQSRISPTPLDLMIAVAAGGAGAFGLSRPDVSDSLPGVAVAIALVPPLTVVGICYAQGEIESGHGALLLFLTNALAIIVVGSVMFVLTGVTPLERAASGQHRVRTAALTIGVVSLIVLGGLFLNGQEAITRLIEDGTVRSAVNDWLADIDEFETMDLEIDSDEVVVTVIGPLDATAPNSADLGELLTDRLRRTITVEVRVIKSEREMLTVEPRD